MLARLSVYAVVERSLILGGKMNIENLLSSLRASNKLAIKDKNSALSGRELVQKVLACSDLLTSNGIINETPILLNMSNDVDSVIALLAAWKNQCVVFISNPFTPISKLRNTMDGFGLHAFIGSNVLVRTLAQQSVMPGISAGNTVKLDKLALLKKPHQHCHKTPALQDAAVAIFSSGSTGEPKAILNSFENIYLNAQSHGQAIGLTQNDVVGCALPLYYSYGLVANLLSALIYKATISLSNLNTNFNEKWFEGDAVSVIALTPYYAKDINISSPSLRVMTLGGDALTIKDAERIRTIHPKCELYATYGLTEAGPRVATWRFDNCVLPNTKIAPLGEPLSCCEFYLSNSDLWRDNTNNERGELVIETKTRMLGYLRNGERSTPMSWNKNEVRTGDIFEKKDNGYYFVTRDKDIIVQNGEKIFPAHIESILLTLEEVIDARVIGQPDKEKGEIAEALIQGTDNVDLDRIKRALLGFLPRASMPTNFILVNSIQRAATGKKANKSAFQNISNRLSA